MSKKKSLSMFRTFLALVNNQHGYLNFPAFGIRPRLLAPDDGNGGGGGGGGNDDPDKNPDGSYKAAFVEKLLKEKNNFKKGKEEVEAELKLLKEGKGKGDDGDKTGDDNKFKELLKVKDEDNRKLKEKLDAREKERTDAMKLGTLKQEFDKNGGNAKQWELIQKLADTSKIIIDEDTNVVYGAEGEIKRIKELAPDFFGKKKAGVDDGDRGGDDRHDNLNADEAAAKKTLEGQRLKKTKDGKNPMIDFYAASGMTVTAKRS